VRRLLPHLRLAARTTTLRFELERQRVTIDALLASHRDALFLLDADGALRHCNAPARRLLEERRWLQLRQGRLVPVDPAARTPWRAALATLNRSGVADLDRPLRLRGRDALRSLLVEPLPAGAPTPSLASAGDLLLRAWPEPLTPGETLRRRFGLTPREVELCLAFAEGRTPAEIARTSHRSPQTVKTQLRSIYRKAGVGRLQQLLTLLHGLEEG
jgi:DNA-binding CsgD family transcriptional regulator